MLDVLCHVTRDIRRGWPLEAAGSSRQRQLMGQRERGGGRQAEEGPGLRQSQTKLTIEGRGRGHCMQLTTLAPASRDCGEAGPCPLDRAWTARAGSCQCEICTKDSFYKVPNSRLIGNWSQSKFRTNRLFSWTYLLLYISY